MGRILGCLLWGDQPWVLEKWEAADRAAMVRARGCWGWACRDRAVFVRACDLDLDGDGQSSRCGSGSRTQQPSRVLKSGEIGAQENHDEAAAARVRENVYVYINCAREKASGRLRLKGTAAPGVVAAAGSHAMSRSRSDARAYACAAQVATAALSRRARGTEAYAAAELEKGHVRRRGRAEQGASARRVWSGAGTSMRRQERGGRNTVRVLPYAGLLRRGLYAGWNCPPLSVAPESARGWTVARIGGAFWSARNVANRGRRKGRLHFPLSQPGARPSLRCVDSRAGGGRVDGAVQKKAHGVIVRPMIMIMICAHTNATVV